ncbi:11002_t:CDS:2, partial [Paraglomus occultum]
MESIYKQIDKYFNEVNYTKWNVVECLHKIKNPTFTSASMDEVATVIRDTIKSRRKSNALFVNAKRKLESLELSFDETWRRPEIRQFFNKLDLSYTNKHQRPENIHEEGLIQNVSEDEAQTPPSIAIHSKSIRPLFESIQEDLISSIAEGSLAGEDMASTDIVRKQPLRIPFKNRIFNPYYGVIDLTGQYIELKSAFTTEDWQELREIFSSVVQWQSIQTPEHFVQYFDENCKLPSEPREDLKAFHIAIEFLRQMSYPLEAIMSESVTHALYYPLIVTILRDDITSQLEWGEITSDSSSDAKNSNSSPNNKAKLGHKVDFKLSLKKPNYKLQIVHGEISGGIKDGKTATCKRKHWLDKLKLMVMLRDELNQLIKTYSKLGCAEFLHLVVYGVQVVGLQINVYAMFWCGGGVYLFGLVDQCFVPNNKETLYSLEEAFAVLKTLQVKVTEASRLLMDIEMKHARKRRRSVREERIDPEEL